MESWERERKRREDELAERQRRELKRRKRREAQRRERELRRRRRQQGKKTERERHSMTGPAACPSCGDSERLFTIESAIGYSRGPARFENGALHFEREGLVEMDWSAGTTTIGVACDCGWRGALADLVLARG